MKKVWLQLRREGVNVARCTVERLIRAMGRVGIRRGKGVKPPCSDKDAATPDDLVNRRFMAKRPHQLWVADFTYVSTAQGFVYVAFIVDVFAGVIVGWRVSTSMATSLVLEALALWARRPGKGVNHHSDRGSHSVSLAYSKRLKDAEILASVGTTGDACDNAMAESINGGGQNGGDPPRELEKPDGSGVGHAGLGGRVQQQKVARAAGLHPSC